MHVLAKQMDIVKHLRSCFVAGNFLDGRNVSSRHHQRTDRSVAHDMRGAQLRVESCTFHDARKRFTHVRPIRRLAVLSGFPGRLPSSSTALIDTKVLMDPLPQLPHLHLRAGRKYMDDKGRRADEALRRVRAPLCREEIVRDWCAGGVRCQTTRFARRPKRP